MPMEQLDGNEVLANFLRETTGSENLCNWLKATPKYTTFRINIHRSVSIEELQHVLNLQCTELGAKNIPKLYFLRPDCLVLECWSQTTIDIEEPSHEVIVDASCAAAVLRGAHVYAPGVMGLPPNVKLGDRVKIYGDIEGKCKKGLKVKYEGKKKFVGAGKIKMLRQELFGEGIIPSGIAVHTLLPDSMLPVVNESIYPKGDVLLQNLPSIVCGWVVDAKPGEIILDMCAAPGNKTTHLAEMSSDQAVIIALDKTPQKAARIMENARNHGITCIRAYSFDSAKCCSEFSEGIDNGPPFPENSFDKILLDAPCSGLGQRPLLANKMTRKMLDSYKFVQRKLFVEAVKLLKVGGRLVYSTCTVTRQENELLAAWAAARPAVRLVRAAPLAGGPGWRGCGLTDEQRVLVQRFGPEDDPLRRADNIYRDTIGFFIATFTKVSCDYS